MSAPTSRDRFLVLVRAAIEQGTLVKLTLGKPLPGADPTLRNLFIRPVALKTGTHLCFLWRHATRDITKNHPPAEAIAEIETLLANSFGDGHLFTPLQTAQLQTFPDGQQKVRIKTAETAPQPVATSHDRTKTHALPADAAWLRALGVTNDRGQPREGMAPKFRQIQKFTELLQSLLNESGLRPTEKCHSLSDTFSPGLPPLRIADMGCGKGYLTFATAALLGDSAEITGVERRPDLVDLCNKLARENGLTRLRFEQGDITPDRADPLDVLIALHACDTATDDALAAGINAGARLLVVSPCCQKEVRRQLTAPPVLTDALSHGIFQERQAEFATDALRAQLLEAAGYRTKVFEFISPDHTAKNLMIAAIRHHNPVPAAVRERLQAFAGFYGIREQRLAKHLGISLL
ncbi:MAG: SAM-dependent methyltransferase [Verrucomicrobiota bacterium]